MKTYEKVINTIAGIGFLALVPVGLAVFQVYGPLDALGKLLGFWGSATFLILVFYGLTVIRILFGHAELYAPLVIGVLASFALMCASVKVSFMAWYWALVRQASVLSSVQLLFIAALVVLGIAVLLSGLKKLSVVAEVLILVVFPIATVLVLGYFGVPDFQRLLRLPPARVESP